MWKSPVMQAERGEGILTALYTLLLLTIVLFVGIDIAGYTAAAWKLRNACSETLTLMKIENGLSSEIESAFYEYATVQGLDATLVSVTGTPQKVQRGDIVVIKASMPYCLSSLRPFGQQLVFNINVEMWGMAQDFIRRDE
ncbi:MAG: DUF4320 family protein [Peptococcaceae bacterium]|nr:DUF4320 family protein [Peptococcaceae bacterium]